MRSRSTSRTVLIAHARPTRGGFTAARDEANELASRGWNVLFVSRPGDRLSELQPDVDIAPIDVRPDSVAKWSAEIRRLAKRGNVSLVHLHGRAAGVWGRIALVGEKVPCVYSPHGLPWITSAPQIARELALQRALAPVTTIAAYVSRSEMIEWHTVYGFGHRRNVIFANFVGEIESFEATGNGPIVIAGGYSPQKRLEVVLEAMIESSTDHPALICGTVDDESYFKRLGTLVHDNPKLKGVTVTRELSPLLPVLRNSALAIMPSFREGMPFLGIEILGTRTPVAWSAILPHYELFGSSGFPFWTADELVSLLDLGPAGWSAFRPPIGRLENYRMSACDSREKFYQMLEEEFLT